MTGVGSKNLMPANITGVLESSYEESTEYDSMEYTPSVMVNTLVDSSSYGLYDTEAINVTDIFNRQEKQICEFIKTRQLTVAEVVACFIAVLTVMENLIILIAICKGHRNLRKPPYWFIASLSMADLLTGVEIVVAIFIPIGSDPNSRVVLKGLAVVTFIASINSLLLVSMDRYVRIVRHADYNRLLNQKIITALILGSWLISFGVFLAAPLLGWSCSNEHCCAINGLCTCMKSQFGEEVCGTYCSQSFVPFRKSYILTGLVYFAVSVCVMTSFYYVIFKVVKKKTFGGNDCKTKKREIQLAKTLVLTLGIFVLCWLPVQGLFIADLIVTKPNEKLSEAFDFALVPSVINSFTNPIIYSIRLPQMRASIQRIFLPCIYGQTPNGSNWVSSTSMEKTFRRLSIRKRLNGRNRKSTSNSSDLRTPTQSRPNERGRLMSNKTTQSDNSLDNSKSMVFD